MAAPKKTTVSGKKPAQGGRKAVTGSGASKATTAARNSLAKGAGAALPKTQGKPPVGGKMAVGNKGKAQVPPKKTAVSKSAGYQGKGK
jgi:hypothetical protein